MGYWEIVIIFAFVIEGKGDDEKFYTEIRI
ncbi:hypothetical protein SATMO3_56230 [Sporomusa aerivorans]